MTTAAEQVTGIGVFGIECDISQPHPVPAEISEITYCCLSTLKSKETPRIRGSLICICPDLDSSAGSLTIRTWHGCRRWLPRAVVLRDLNPADMRALLYPNQNLGRKRKSEIDRFGSHLQNRTCIWRRVLPARLPVRESSQPTSIGSSRWLPPNHPSVALARWQQRRASPSRPAARRTSFPARVPIRWPAKS